MVRGAWRVKISFAIARIVGLLAFGFPGLLRQWRSLLVLILMLFPYGIFNKILDNWLYFNHLTTVTSAFLLHYVGLKATYQDVLLTLPTGQVTVGYCCTGGNLILWLLGLVLIMEIVFPLT